MKLTVAVGVGAGLALLAGCSPNFGAPKPIPYQALALDVPAGASADSVASIVRGSSAGLVLLAGPADSAWFGQVARATNLKLSGPTRTPPALRMAFLAGKPVGDTTLTLPVQGGRPLVMHDALYEPRKNRHLDLMMVQIDTASPASAVARALLTYVATDVNQNSPVVLGLIAPNRAIADSVAQLIRPIFVDVRECGGNQGDSAVAAPVRVLYGPETQIYCDEARLLPGTGTPVYARVTLGQKP